MNVTLTPEQQQWLNAQVAVGNFASIEEALTIAIADLMALYDDDLAWTKPYVDQARASVGRGDVLSQEAYFQGLETKIAALRSS
jgi:antitoxin ParD1/3/4